jgi:5-methylcytosine-specific restriction endonuclease McrA
MRKRSIESDLYTLDQVAERDDYTCCLCWDEPVDMMLRVPNFWAPTVDHVIPLACGGTDTWDNIQLAHFICNSYKGDGEFTGLPPRVGGSAPLPDELIGAARSRPPGPT